MSRIAKGIFGSVLVLLGFSALFGPLIYVTGPIFLLALVAGLIVVGVLLLGMKWLVEAVLDDS